MTDDSDASGRQGVTVTQNNPGMDAFTTAASTAAATLRSQTSTLCAKIKTDCFLFTLDSITQRFLGDKCLRYGSTNSYRLVRLLFLVTPSIF